MYSEYLMSSRQNALSLVPNRYCKAKGRDSRPTRDTAVPQQNDILLLFRGNELAHGGQTTIGVFVAHDREYVFFHVSDKR